MKLFKISQNVNNDYDTYSDAVVCAPDEETARNMDPGSGEPNNWDDGTCFGWCESANQVRVQYLGEAVDTVKQGIVCASFHAG